jgi:hypothetical protein
MNRSRIARSFTLSLVIVVSVLAIPLIRCSTSTASGSAGSQANAQGNNCKPDTNPQSPQICISSTGVDPKAILVNSKKKGGDHVTIRMTGPPTSTVAITTAAGQCSNVKFPACGSGSQCLAQTDPLITGTCTYSVSLNGSTVTDPTIETDSCCATMIDEPKRPHR